MSDEKIVGDNLELKSFTSSGNTKKPFKVSWIVIFLMGFVILILLYVLFFVPKKNISEEANLLRPTIVISKTVMPTIDLNVGKPLSTSDSISDIDADLFGTDLSSLDAELHKIENELSSN